MAAAGSDQAQGSSPIPESMRAADRFGPPSVQPRLIHVPPFAFQSMRVATRSHSGCHFNVRPDNLGSLGQDS